jgi:hypothetical protein
MRQVLHIIAALLVVSAPALAQSIDLKIVKLNDKGVVEVTKTISQPQEYTYQVQVPIQQQVIQNGQPVVQVVMVTETRRGTRMTQTSGYAPLEEKDAKFTDLQGKPANFADIKKTLEKGPIAVIALPKDAAMPSAAILQAFKTDTLILRVESEITTKKTTAMPVPGGGIVIDAVPAIPALPPRVIEQKIEVKKAE